MTQVSDNNSSSSITSALYKSFGDYAYQYKVSKMECWAHEQQLQQRQQQQKIFLSDVFPCKVVTMEKQKSLFLAMTANSQIQNLVNVMEAVSVAAAVQSQQKQWSGCHIMISAYRGNASYYNQLKPDPALFNWSALFHEKNLPTTDLESLLQDIIGTLCHLEIVCPSAASAENRYFQFSGQWYEMLRACDDWKSSAAASSSYSALEAFLMKECILHVLPSSSSSLQQQLRWKWDDAHEFELVPESELKDHHPPQQQSPQLTWMLEGMGSEQIADWCTKQTDEVLQFVCQMSSNLRKGWSHVECFLQQHGGVTRYIQQECEKIDQGHDGGGEWQWMDGHWYRPIAAVKNKKNKLVTTEEGEESVKKTKL